MDIQQIKQRFGIIGSASGLNRAISKAIQVAPTDISVLVVGESGTGKEVMPKIIHQLSTRKHGSYIAVNCGAIPEGTIDSELFGHEKGSFTGASAARQGYFESANGGTIFLDEVAELPLSTQVRLLRVLETGEFMKVGSSKIIKTDVRIVAATNVNMAEAINKQKFREDLYYRLNTVQLSLPALRERKEDIHLLFRKFARDFAEKYHMPPVQLSPDAVQLLENYTWPGNIRQLRNFAEQISVVEENRDVSVNTLMQYLPESGIERSPIVYKKNGQNSNDFSEREILYKVLFDMKNDLQDLKKLTMGLIQNEDSTSKFKEDNAQLIKKIYKSDSETSAPQKVLQLDAPMRTPEIISPSTEDIEIEEAVESEPLTLQDMEIKMIKQALKKHEGKRKDAADELNISERTLYRKIKQYNL